MEAVDARKQHDFKGMITTFIITYTVFLIHTYSYPNYPAVIEAQIYGTFVTGRKCQHMVNG